MERPKKRGQKIRGVEKIYETSAGLFGTAPHSYENVNLNLKRYDSVVSEFRPGDHFRFMRNIGDGGGHSLHVRNFKAMVELQDHL